MFGRLVEITAAAVILLEAAPAYAQSYRPFVVKTPDAVNISAQEWGNPNGKEIVFIHGFMQSHLSWTKQVRDPELARQFRMISYDFRGHGGSDKILGSEALRQRRSVRGRVECGDPEHVPEEAGARRMVLWHAHHQRLPGSIRFGEACRHQFRRWHRKRRRKIFRSCYAPDSQDFK